MTRLDGRGAYEKVSLATKESREEGTAAELRRVTSRGWSRGCFTLGRDKVSRQDGRESSSIRSRDHSVLWPWGGGNSHHRNHQNHQHLHALARRLKHHFHLNTTTTATTLQDQAHITTSRQHLYTSPSEQQSTTACPSARDDPSHSSAGVVSRFTSYVHYSLSSTACGYKKGRRRRSQEERPMQWPPERAVPRRMSARVVERENGAAARAPAIQVIVLGAGGGPLEHNVTALLIRSVKTGWSRGSVIALDAGVHLSSITRILEETQPPGLGTSVALPHILETGPFAGMEITSTSAATNAGYVTRHLVDTFLITHPHLDHISGFVINTAGLPGARPKRLAGLPSTIAAFKQHIFNNVIWPNLSDENNGAGLVTYMRLVEGGSPALGEGDGKGYLEISDELGVKLFSVSHGHCIERHPHRGSSASSRFGSFDATSLTASPRGAPGSTAASGPPSLFRNSAAGQEKESFCVYDSSAYFIRDNSTGREVLMFGDVEPDAISLSPRNLGIWQEAAPRIANGNLAAIFIECSYDNSQTDDRLFGHLTPRYVIREMQALASAVETARHAPSKLDLTKKRKRDPGEANGRPDTATNAVHADDHPVSPKSTRPAKKGPSSVTGGGEQQSQQQHSGFDTPHISTPTAELSLKDLEASTAPTVHVPQFANALRGLKVVIIHVKDRLVDGEAPRDAIRRQLLEAEKEAQLGCEFIVSSSGQSFYL